MIVDDQSERRVQGALVGLAIGLAVFAGNVLGFFLALTGCYEENLSHRPGACAAKPAFAVIGLVGVLGVAAAFPILGALGARARRLAVSGALAWTSWALYVAAIVKT